MPDKPDKARHTKLIEEARDRFKLCEEAENKLRSDALEDLRFRKGEQWPQKYMSLRDKEDRPCLTINVLPARERQILNDQRQNRPAIHVNPVDSKGDPDTAEIIQGIIRHIEDDSNADAAYDTAFASAVRMGFGYVRITPEYESPLEKAVNGRQVLKIKRVRNPFMIYMDPSCQEPDYSDARFGFCFTNLTKDEFEEQYPDSDLVGVDDWASLGDAAPGWLEKDGVRIAEYYYFKNEKKTICRYQDGSVGLKEDADPSLGEPVEEVEDDVPCLKWCKFNASEVLEETDIDSEWIPIIPCLGDELDVDGERVLEGMVRHTKDAVRMQNYLASAEVEAIGTAKSGSWLVAAGQLEGFEKDWRDPNPKILQYKLLDAGGKPAPAPQLIVAEPAIQSITNARLQFADDFKAVTGIYDAQLGQKSNETSGLAIRNRQQQGQLSNFHYVDNLTRMIRHAGRILVRWIPYVYDTPRVMRIIGEDGSQKTVQINQQFMKGGAPKIYDVRVGKYDVTVSSGPSYKTKREEAVATQLELMKVLPNEAPFIADIAVSNMDIPQAKQLSERLKRMLPPQLQDDDGTDPKIAAAKLAQQNGQLQQHIQVISQEYDKIKQQQDAKVVEYEYRMAIEKLKVEASVAIAEITSKRQESMTRLQFEQDVWKQTHDTAHERAMQEDQQQHEMGQAQAQHDAAAQSQDNQQGHEQDMAVIAAEAKKKAGGNGGSGAPANA